MEDQKLAVIFPGIGYHKDKPLLYYAAKMAKQCGYEIIYIDYHDMPQKIRGNAEMMQTAASLAAAQSREVLQAVRLDAYAEILLIGKSIGTVAAAQLASEWNAPVRQIWIRRWRRRLRVARPIRVSPFSERRIRGRMRKH